MATPQDVFNLMMRNVRSKAQDLYNRADRDKSMSGFQFARGGLGNKINKVLQTPVSVPKPVYQGAKSAYGALTKLPSSQYVMGRGQESANRIIGGVEALQRPGIGNKALGGLSILSGGLSLTPAGQAREALVGVPLAGIRTGSQLLTGQQATPMENLRRGVTGYESVGSAVNPLTRKLLGEQGGDIASQALDIGNMALGMYKGGRYDPETKYLNTIRNLPENFTPRPGSILKKVDLTKPEMAARTRFENVAGPVFDVKKPIGKQDAKVVARIFEGAANNKKVDPSEIADVKALGKKYLKGVNIARLSPEQIVTDLHKRANAPKMTEFMSKVDTPKLSVEPTGEVSSPILSSDPGTRKGIRTGQEKVTDLLSKTKLEKPSKGGIPTRTKASSEVSLESIIPKKGKLNLARLAVDDVGKQALEDINRELPTSVITNKSVIEKAKTAKGSKGALSDEKMQEMIAQQLKNRQQVVDLSAKFSKAKADGASEQELAKIMLELSNQSRVAQQGGTFAGRLLQAQNIIADQSASPMQKILALLDNAGADQAKYTKDAIKVNWDNPTEVVTFYRKYVPPKLGEVLDEIRYTNMLSSPLTHIVNIASNALQSGVVAPVEKTITGLLDAARSSITGAERKYYASAGIDYTKGYIKSLPEAWTKAKNIMTQKEISLKPDMEFVPTGVGGPLQVYTTPLRALEAMDQFFRTLVKGGVTEELGKAPQKMTMARIAKSAEDEANYRLFRQSFDPNGELGQGTVLQFFDKWNSAISNLRRLPGGKWVLPFLQTPTNILKQGFEFSPLGVSTMVGAKNPIEQLSKAIIGTGVFATAYQLAQSGLTSWDAPTGQKERELYYAAGMQPYSIKIGDKWVSFSKLGPLAYPIAMAAALGDAERTKPDQTRLQAIGNSIGGMLGFFGDQSYVRSIGDLVESIQGGVSVGPNAIAGQAANFAGQMIPYRSFLTWMGRMVDPTYRKATTFTERLKKDLPIMGSQLEAYTDPLGRPSMRDLPFLNAVSPFRVSQEKEGVKLYDQYKEARIQRAVEKRMAEGLEEGQSVGTGTTYQYMKDGDLKKIDIGKVSQMPEKTEFDKLKKKKESFKLVDDILDNLEPEQQAEALNKLGISSEDAQYYNIARQDNDLKYAYVQDQIAAIAKTSKNREDFLKFLVEGRKDINGQMIISDGVIDDLYDANLITAEEKKQLKNFEYDPTTQKYKLKSTGRGSGARLKQIQPIKRKMVLKSGKEFVSSIRAGSPLSQENLNKVQLGEGIRLKMPTL